MWDCTHAIRDLTDRSEGALRDAAKFAWKCVPKVMEAQMTGLGLLAGVVLTAVATVVALVSSPPPSISVVPGRTATAPGPPRPLRHADQRAVSGYSGSLRKDDI